MRHPTHHPQIDFWSPNKYNVWMLHVCPPAPFLRTQQALQAHQWYCSLLQARQVSYPKLQSRHGSCLADCLPRGLLGFAYYYFSWSNS